MNESDVMVRRALISVSNKRGVVDFARRLHECNVSILSTGGTSQLFREANIPVCDVADVTHFPEMMDGRIKTLHPIIHGGILGLRDAHQAIATSHDIQWIDLVVVNLYPFSETIKKTDVTFDQAIEQIDIGGPAMIRSAAKNMGWVGVVIDPDDYAKIVRELTEKKSLSFTTRKQLAKKAFAYTAQYDSLITQYLSRTDDLSPFSDKIELTLEKHKELRYGENPHQAACAYRLPGETGILRAKQYQGKELSYNNMTDADAAFACVRELNEPACVIVKHANPCGAATAETLFEAYTRAFSADSEAAFGGIIALNRICTKEIALSVSKVFFEILIAPSYEADALTILEKKPHLRVLEWNLERDASIPHEMKFIAGGVLLQEKNIHRMSETDLSVVTKKQPSDEEIQAMLFAWPVLKHIKSNAILIATNAMTKGIGAGQVSRVDAVDIAIKKAGKKLVGAILASDAFFPFRDSIDRLADTEIRAIIQPGGSMRDNEVIAACDEHGIAMVFTGTRCFKH